MGVEACFCCFRNKNPVCLSSVGLAANIITFGFILWGILDLNFIKKGSEPIYIISFVLSCLCLLFYFIIYYSQANFIRFSKENYLKIMNYLVNKKKKKRIN